jgi:hypothetical protein
MNVDTTKTVAHISLCSGYGGIDLGLSEDSGQSKLGEQAQNNSGKQLNPDWVETLMGLPIGWTDVNR